MIRKKTRLVAVFLSVLLLFSCAGCKLQPMIISDAEAPNVTLEKFFTELKSKNYEDCDTYLANNATFVVTNNTDYDFMDDLIDLEIDKLDYQLIGEPEIDGVNASQQVRITALDMDKLTQYMEENIVKVEYDYLVDNNKSSFDKENGDDVSDVMRIAIEKYAESAGRVQNIVTVNFKFQNDAWKIIVDSNLTAAIFGGSVDE